MEHLLIPSDGLPSEFNRVPWLGGVYDRGNFQDWPERNRRHEIHRNGDGCDIKVYTELFDPPHEEYTKHHAFALEYIAQTWLLFGLFHAFFGDDFQEADFTQYDENGSEAVWVTTAKLNALIDQWVSRQLPEPQLDAENLFLCLQWVQSLLNRLRHPSFDQRLALCIITSAESLGYALGRVKVALEGRPYDNHQGSEDQSSGGKISQRTAPIDGVQKSWRSSLQAYRASKPRGKSALRATQGLSWVRVYKPRIYYIYHYETDEENEIRGFPAIERPSEFDSQHFWDEHAYQIMLTNNWCPQNAHITLRSSKNLCAAFYLSCLKKPDDDRYRHERCSRKHCVRSEVAYKELEKEGSTHLADCRGCEELGFEGELSNMMEEMVFNDEIPIVAVQLPLSGQTEKIYYISIVPFTPGLKYRAFSHVWADGTGNPSSNKLRTCQLTALIAAIRAISNEEEKPLEEEHDSTEYLWIDTLCCPVGNKRARATIISKMRSIYANADSVIVLDKEMLQQLQVLPRYVDPHGYAPVFELGGRLLSSGWMRRLWTLQEAIFAKKLYVVLDHAIFPLHYFQTSLRHGIRQLKLPANYRIISDAWFRDLHVLTNPGGAHRSALQASDIARGVEGRHLSQPGDEPLCLSTLFGMSEEQQMQIASANGDDRSKVFWHLLLPHLKLSSEIAFYRGPKLNILGFRWAPESLTTLDTHTFLNPCSFCKGCGAEVIDGGLRVCLPGSPVVVAQYPFSTDNDPIMIIVVRELARTLLLLPEHPPTPNVGREMLNREREFALVMGHSTETPWRRKGALLFRNRHERTDDKYYVFCITHVYNWAPKMSENIDSKKAEYYQEANIKFENTLSENARDLPGSLEPIKSAARIVTDPSWKKRAAEYASKGTSARLDRLQSYIRGTLFIAATNPVVEDRLWDLNFDVGWGKTDD